MAKDEMMDLGSILVQFDLEVLTIKKLNIVEAANEHGRMELVFLTGKSISPGDCSRYQDSPIQVRTREVEGIWYEYDPDNRPRLIHFPEGGTERRWYDGEGN